MAKRKDGSGRKFKSGLMQAPTSKRFTGRPYDSEMVDMTAIRARNQQMRSLYNDSRQTREEDEKSEDDPEEQQQILDAVNRKRSTAQTRMEQMNLISTDDLAKIFKSKEDFLRILEVDGKLWRLRAHEMCSSAVSATEARMQHGLPQRPDLRQEAGKCLGHLVLTFPVADPELRGQAHQCASVPRAGRQEPHPQGFGGP